MIDVYYSTNKPKSVDKVRKYNLFIHFFNYLFHIVCVVFSLSSNEHSSFSSRTLTYWSQVQVVFMYVCQGGRGLDNSLSLRVNNFVTFSWSAQDFGILELELC